MFFVNFKGKIEIEANLGRILNLSWVYLSRALSWIYIFSKLTLC